MNQISLPFTWKDHHDLKMGYFVDHILDDRKKVSITETAKSLGIKKVVYMTEGLAYEIETPESFDDASPTQRLVSVLTTLQDKALRESSNTFTFRAQIVCAVDGRPHFGVPVRVRVRDYYVLGYPCDF